MNYQNSLSRVQKQFGLNLGTPSATYLLFVSSTNAKKDKLAMVFLATAHMRVATIISVLNVRPSECHLLLGFSELRAESVKVSIVKRSATLAFVRHD